MLQQEETWHGINHGYHENFAISVTETKRAFEGSPVFTSICSGCNSNVLAGRSCLEQLDLPDSLQCFASFGIWVWLSDIFMLSNWKLPEFQFWWKGDFWHYCFVLSGQRAAWHQQCCAHSHTCSGVSCYIQHVMLVQLWNCEPPPIVKLLKGLASISVEMCYFIMIAWLGKVMTSNCPRVLPDLGFCIFVEACLGQ